MMTRAAERELATGTWADAREPGQSLVALHCLFDGRVLVASRAILRNRDGSETETVDELRTDLLECEGMSEADATWIMVAP